jgi:hypothetical protein
MPSTCHGYLEMRFAHRYPAAAAKQPIYMFGRYDLDEPDLFIGGWLGPALLEAKLRSADRQVPLHAAAHHHHFSDASDGDSSRGSWMCGVNEEQPEAPGASLGELLLSCRQ